MWSGTGPIAIGCAPALLSELSEVLMRGFRRFPWGGVESGGLLFGTRDDSKIRIDSYRPVECEHQYGPAFELSEKDLDGLEKFLAKAIPEEEAKGYQLVGWYHSISSRNLGLSEHDRTFHKRFFPEPWQLCMVLRRSKQDPLTVGFFGRDGSDHLEALGQPKEFAIENFRIRELDLPAVSPLASSSPIAQSKAEPPPELPVTTADPRENAVQVNAVEQNAADKVTPEPSDSADRIAEFLPVAAEIVEEVPEPAAPAIQAPAEPPAAPVVVMPLPVREVATAAIAPSTDEPAIAPWSSTESAPQSPFEYFGLSRDPFSQTPEPRLFYPSPGHREALAMLLHGIRRRSGFSALVGEAGVGKSLVLECLIEQLKLDRVQFAYLFNSKVNSEQFFELLANDLDLQSSSLRKSSILIALNEHLVRQCQIGQTTALIIDNAQKLQPEVLEEIELLGNLENRQGKLLQVVFAGQPSFESRLERPELRGLRQRLLSRARLGPLTQEHMAGYIASRLKIAGVSSEQIFPPEIVTETHLRTGGVPRLINAVGAALLQQCMDCAETVVRQEMLESVCSSLDLTVHGRRESNTLESAAGAASA